MPILSPKTTVPLPLASTVVVVAPSGHRVEGLSLQQVALLLQELSEEGEIRRFVVHREDKRTFAFHGRYDVTVGTNVANSIGLLM